MGQGVMKSQIGTPLRLKQIKLGVSKGMKSFTLVQINLAHLNPGFCFDSIKVILLERLIHVTKLEN